jgi:LysM repeat protein
MGTAQATADVMAASGNCAHIGNARGRIAAAGYGGGATVFATENIACGLNLSVETTVYTYWADATHMLPMTDANYTHIGGGVTVVDGRVFYVIHAAYVSGGTYSSAPVSPGSGTAKPAATAGVVKPVITATPGSDGSVIHEVQPGQALWSIAIAYGVKIADLIALNKLSANPVLSIGQKVMIRAAATPTSSPTVTLTPRPPTRTPTPTATPRTPTVTPTVTLTPTPTHRPFLNIQPPDAAQRNSLGIGIIAVSGIGLLLVVFSSLRKKN